ncbi:MAG TPA: hypothetical protein VIW92_06000, partial [Thermoanaerobaculia bacterium]
APATPPPAAPSGDPALREQLAAAQAQLEQLEALQKKSQEAVTQAQEQIAQFQREGGQPLRPRINSFTEDLGNPDVERAEAASRKQIPADREAHLLLPRAKDEGLPESREIQILDRAGKVVWQDAGLIPDEHGYYSLGLPAGFLAPGQYKVQLFTREAGKRVPRERWEIEVVKSLPAAD